MLMLTFDVNGCRYAVDVARVVEVVPRIALRPIPHAPPFLAGLFDLGGRMVPVVDLGVRLGGEPCRPRLSTRIVVAEDAAGRLLGLIGERVTELRAGPEGLRDDRAAALDGAPYLGPIVPLGGDLVQAIRVDGLLPGDLRETLYGAMLRGA